MAEEERKPMPLLMRQTTVINLENGFENVHIKNDPLDIIDQNSMEESCINNLDDNEEEMQPLIQQPVSLGNRSTPIKKYSGDSASLDLAVNIDLGVGNISNIVDNQMVTPVIKNKFNTPQNSKNSPDLSYFIEYNKNGDTQMSQNSDSTLEDSLLLTDNTFSCSFCSFTTDKQKVLGDHERNHRKTNLPIFQCFYCSQSYTKHMLYLHVQSVHPGQKFQIRDKDGLSFSCFKCLFQTDKEEDLNEHMNTHFSEPTSEKTSDSDEENSAQIPELNTNTEKQVSDNCKVQCELCSYVCPNARDIKFHMNSHWKKLPIIKCSRCPFRSTSTALRYHMKNCRKTSKTSKENPPKAVVKTFRCSVCLFTTTEKAKLDIHAKIHVASQPKAIAKTLKCSACAFTTMDKAKLDVHAKIHVPVVSNEEQPYRCFKCSFATLDEDRMWEHMQTHINAAKKAAVQLEAEKDTSSTDEFECAKCTFSTDSQHKLNAHLKSHSSASEPAKRTAQEIFKCQECSFRTTVKESLNIHAKKHLYEPIKIQSSGGRCLYRCKMCSYERPNNSNLEGHMNSHRLNQPIRKCPNCDFRSTRHALTFHRTKCQGESSEATEPSSSSLTEKGEEVSETETNSDSDLEPLRSTGATGMTYKCNLCSYETHKTSNIRIHLKSHKKNLAIEKCPRCPFRSTLGALRFHSLNCKSVSLPQTTIKVPSRSIFKCSDCPFKTTMRLKLNAHVKNHRVFPVQSYSSGKHLYHCGKCSYSSTKHTTVKSHMNLHKLNLPIDKCPNCEFRSTKQAMAFHVIKCNGKSNAIESDIDDSVDNTTESTASSVEDSQDDEVQTDTEGYRRCDESGRRIYKCQTCSYFTKKTTRIHAHVKTHELKLPMVDCPKCDFRSTSRVVKWHIKKCKEKSKVTTDDASLPFKCTSCSFSTSLRIKLKSHVRKYHSVVSKIKLFSCKTCSFVTKKRNLYQKHLQGHSLVVPVLSATEDQTSSQGGDKTSETGNNSKESETTTTEEGFIESKQGFKCASCSYTCLMKSNMIRHINGHKKYNWPIIKCRGCDYRSINLNVLSHEKKCNKLGGVKMKKTLNPSNDLDYRTCPYCFSNIRKPCFANYRMHLEEVHFDKIYEQDVFRVFRCADCKFATILYAKLSQHQNDTKHQVLEKNEANTDDHYSDKSDTKETKSDSKVGHRSIKKCKFCSFTSTLTNCLAIHLRLHTEWKQPIKKCRWCDYRSTCHALQSHQKKCPRKKDFVKKMTVTYPMTGNQFKCPLCPLTLSHMGNLKKHVDTLHGDELTDQNRFPVLRCSQCDFVTIYHEQWRLHADESKHQLIDEKKNEKDNNFTKKDSEGENTISKEKVRFNCEFCDFSTHLNVKLKIHVKKRHSELEEGKGTTNDTTYQCQFCSYATETSVSYKQHMDNAHFDKVTEQDKCQVYTCLDCDFASVFISRAVRHREATNHTLSNVPNQARKRPPGVVRKKKLPLAQWSKTVKCTYCSYSCKFSERHNMKRHMLSHTVKQKPIKQCKSCDYKSTAGVLIRHQKICTGARSEENDEVENQCKFCSYTSFALSNFKKHLDSMHNERLPEQDMFKVFGCLNCNFVTIYYRKMMIHRDETKHNFVSGVKKKSGNRAEASKTVRSKKRDEVNVVDVSSDEEKFEKPATEKKRLFRCTECPFTTYLRIQLNLHVKKYHKRSVRPSVKQKRVSYKCKCCSYATINKAHLARHMVNHEKQRPIEQCANCDFKSTLRALKEHESNCDGTGQKEITSDHKPTKKMKISPKKAVRQSGNDEHRCTFCKFHSFHHSAYKLHMENIHFDKIKEQSAFAVYKCLKCEFCTIYIPKMLRHTVQTLHTYEKLENYSEPLPSEKRKYSDKARENSSDEDPPDKNEEFSCKKCSFTTGYKGNLKRHMDVNKHSRSTELTANKSLSKKEDKLKPEKQNKKIIPKTEEVFMSSPGTYSCRHCSYTTEVKTNLLQHLETHDKWNLPIEQCSNCDYRSTPRALQCHASKCPGKTKTTSPTDGDTKEIYSCNICSYTSNVKTALKVHLDRSHSTKQLPVKQCANCDFTGTRSVLEGHGPKCPNKTDAKKALTCPQCSYTTVMPKLMRNHQEQKHPKAKEVKPEGPKTFKCEYCSFTSFWQYLIEKHMNSHTLLKLPIESCERCDFRSTPSALAAHTKVCTAKKRDRSSSESSRGSCSSNDVNNDLIDPPVKKLKVDRPRSEMGLSDLQESGIASNSPSIDERESVVENSFSDTSSIDKNSINSTSVSNVSLTSSGSNSRFAFTCLECPFSTNLRIKLNVHIQKSH